MISCRKSETLRIDDANRFYGVRLNVFTSIVIAVGALVYLVISARRRPGREDPVELRSERGSDSDRSVENENTTSDAAAAESDAVADDDGMAPAPTSDTVES